MPRAESAACTAAAGKFKDFLSNEDGLFEDVAGTLRSVTDKDIEIRKQLRRATKAQGLFERALESVTRMNPKKMHDSGESEFAFVGISKEDGYVYTLALREETEKGAPATDDIENGPLKGAGRASNVSIPQNPKMSTPKSDFSFENVSEEADRSADEARRLR